MKVNILKPAVLAAVTVLAACTNEVIESSGNNDLTLGQGEDVIRISLSNTTATRAARPISSSEAKNNVNRLAFRFLTNGHEEVQYITLDGVIDEEGQMETEYKVNGNVLELPDTYTGSEIRVKFSGLKEGVYKILVYGYNYTSGTDGEDAFPYDISLHDSEYLLKCENVTTVQEIFAGSNQNGTTDEYVKVNQHDKFTTPPTIKLERQVAGLLAYFKEAPVFVNNTKVAKVTVSSKATITGFYMPAALMPGSQLQPSNNMRGSEYNGIYTDGWAGSTWVNYLTFDMSKATNYNDTHLDNGDYYKFKQYLLADETAEISGLVCNENTLFGSCFLLAFPAYNDFSIKGQCATLNICYWDENGDLILSVPLRSGGSENDALTANSYQYAIKCNNFYSIGTKKTGDNSDGNDNPISIDESTGYDYANVSISSDWENTHGLIN